MTGPSVVAEAVGTSRGRLTAVLTAARREYARAVRDGEGGRETQSRYAAQMDLIVAALVSAAVAQVPGRVAVCALGGYGRRTLCLHSDVDLLIVFDGRIGPAQEQLVNAVLQPLWDLQLVVGNHVRELDELDAVDGDNAEFTMAMLDARLIAGDEALGAAVQSKSALIDASKRVHAVDSLLALIDRRHAEYNQTIYQLEPDVKSAPGGLRDITAVRSLRALQPGAFEAEGGRPAEALTQAEEFLLRVRSRLHVETGRDANVLTHELQERIAGGLGFDRADPQRRVEALMGAYFRSARSTVRALARARRAATPSTAHAPQRRVGSCFEIGRDGLQFLDPAAAAAKPELWLELFGLAVAHGCAVSAAALDVIEQHAENYGPDDFAASEAARDQIRSLLHPRPGLYARLSEMHDCGLLTRIFPELEGIHGRVIRDFYHRYTVDEHTLLTIRGLETLPNAATPSRQRFGGLLQELRSPQLLTLALLLHDIGKAEDVDHAQESVRRASAALDRLDVGPDARDTIEFLIRHHLEMSRVAFRRDLEDPHVVVRFARLVGTEERLKMLCLLTLVDVEAVSSTTLTPWKEELLWRLYVDTYNHLTLGYGDELVRHDPAGLAAVLAERPKDIDAAELTHFVSGLPRRYLSLFSLASIYRHVRLARGIQPNEVHTVLENRDDVWELTIVTLDKPYLFSNVAGVLSYFGMDIHRGQAMTTPDGLVLDVFDFADAGSFLCRNPDATADICRMLDRVVAGWVDVPSLLRGRERSVLYRRRTGDPATVHFDNEHSKKYSVLEIVADDAPGLLYRISRVVSELGCDLDLALIETEGRKAVDVLHVTKAGRKLVEAERAGLIESLERVLNGPGTGEGADETR